MTTINLDLEKPIANLFDSFNSNAFKERLYSVLTTKKNFDEIEISYALATNKLKTSEDFN